MKTLFLSAFLCLLMGCMDTSHVGGYRKNGDANRLLRLSEDDTFIMNSGYTGAYRVEGRKITLSDPTFGNAEGVIDGSTVTFPESSTSDTAKNAAGVWQKIGGRFN